MIGGEEDFETAWCDGCSDRWRANCGCGRRIVGGTYLGHLVDDVVIRLITSLVIKANHKNFSIHIKIVLYKYIYLYVKFSSSIKISISAAAKVGSECECVAYQPLSLQFDTPHLVP